MDATSEPWARPEMYFDLTGWEYRDLFADLAQVWGVLPRLPGYLRERMRPGLAGTVRPGAWVEGEVELAPGAVIEPGAFVSGPAIIGPGAVIRHGAYLRGNCLIGARCIVGHATELKGAILLDGAQAPHFNYVGDTVIGRDVNLGAGVKISNFKNDGSPIEVRFAGRSYPTGLRKFGAIIGDSAALGCNAVTSPGTLIGKQTLVYANAVLRGVYPAGVVVKVRQSAEVVERR